MKKAVVYGSVLASFTVEKLGTESMNYKRRKVKRLTEIREFVLF